MKNFVKGLVFGASFGGITGLLFAPKKGKELQKDLSHYVVDVKDNLNETKHDLSDVQEKLNQTQQTVDTLIPQFTRALQKDLDAFEFQMTPRVERVNEQVSTLQQHLAEAKAKFEQLH